MDITIYGDMRAIDTHLAAYGLAAILGGESRITYNSATRRISVRTPLNRSDVECAIEDRVKSLASPHTGWAVAGSDHTKDVPVAVASAAGYASPFPSKALFRSRDDIADRYAKRDEIIGSVSALEAETIVAMGKPQYWRGDAPRDGATQLMPAAGDGGREQLVNNTLKDAVRAGVHELSGAEMLDDLTSATTRVSTIQEWAPAPVPLVKTLVAMYGITVAPTSVTSGVPARTPGCVYAPQSATSNNKMTVLPLFTSPVSLERIRGVIGHGAWLPLVRTNGRSAGKLYRKASAAAWVREQGVVASMVFVPEIVQIGPKMSNGQFREGFVFS